MYASILDSVRALAKKLGADPNGEDIETVLNNISEAKGGKRTHKKSIAAAIDNITEVSDPVEPSENNAKFAATPAVFKPSNNMESIDIPDGVTAIGSTAFQSHTYLKNVTIPNSVTSIQASAFSNCKSLTNVTIPNSVTSIGSSVFQSCTALTDITIPSSVRTIENTAFNGCTVLKTITIDKPEGSITGAPWGAPETTQIIWNG